MAPDLNSLPPSSAQNASRNMASSSPSNAANGEQQPTAATAAGGESPTRSPRSASISLQAAAALNAGLQRVPTRQTSNSSLSRNPASGRRRSAVLMNLQLNDPAVPSPGEMINSESQGTSFRTSSPQPLSGSPLLPTADPHHNRTPSLGELHQELEAEQEAQVNRLLQMIRQQQLQLSQLQAQQGQGQGQSAVAADESAIVSERSATAATSSQPGSAPQSAFPGYPQSGSFSRSPGVPHHPRSSFDMARADLQRRSRTPSRGASPRLRATSIGGESDQWVLGGRDESAFYQAETNMLVRENQMLRHRIRDLERQLADMGTNNVSQITHEPPQHSHLLRAQSIEDESPRGLSPGTTSEVPPPIAEAAKEG
jgi:hypothetical protein